MGIHAVNFNVRPSLLECRAEPCAQTASADGQDHRIQSRHLADEFQPGGPGALQGEGAFKRMDEGPAFFLFDLPDAGKRVVWIVGQHDFRAQLPAQFHP